MERLLSLPLLSHPQTVVSRTPGRHKHSSFSVECQRGQHRARCQDWGASHMRNPVDSPAHLITQGKCPSRAHEPSGEHPAVPRQAGWGSQDKAGTVLPRLKASCAAVEKNPHPPHPTQYMREKTFCSPGLSCFSATGAF